MSRPVEEIPLDDVNLMMNMSLTVGDTTRSGGGTPAERTLEVDKFKHQQTDRA